MRIWLFSDPHGKHRELTVPEDIDMAICAGDMGTYKNPNLCKKDLHNGLEWFNNLDQIDFKIYVPGNHDTALEAELIHPTQYKWIDILNHEYAEFDGIKIFGSPYTPSFGVNWAYNAWSDEKHEIDWSWKNKNTYPMIEPLWEDIPEDLDILITHGPPHGILDRCADGYRAGCKHLMERINEVKPKIHVFGHIHEDGGKSEAYPDTTFYNASVLDLRYQHNNNGHVIEI